MKDTEKETSDNHCGVNIAAEELELEDENGYDSDDIDIGSDEEVVRSTRVKGC